MNIYDYIILGIIAVCLAAAAVSLIRLRKKGKTLCGGDCSACRGCTYKSEKS